MAIGQPTGEQDMPEAIGLPDAGTNGVAKSPTEAPSLSSFSQMSVPSISSAVFGTPLSGFADSES
jgi:hypothetical protein